MTTKRIFTPFTRQKAGTLATNLAKSDKAPTGFAPDEYVFAAEKKGTKTKLLSMLLTGQDSLYVNAHCLKGLGYVSTTVKCTDGDKVNVVDLIGMLKDNGLPLDSHCKIKLWVCEGGLDNGAAEGFARQFSRAMHSGEYHNVRVFGYKASVYGQFKSFTDDVQHDHKGFEKPTTPETIREGYEWSLSRFVEHAKKGETVGDARDWKLKMAVWNHLLQTNHGDEAQAKEALLKNELQRRSLLGDAQRAGVGGRASEVRAEFYNGIEVQDLVVQLHVEYHEEPPK